MDTREICVALGARFNCGDFLFGQYLLAAYAVRAVGRSGTFPANLRMAFSYIPIRSVLGHLHICGALHELWQTRRASYPSTDRSRSSLWVSCFT